MKTRVAKPFTRSSVVKHFGQNRIRVLEIVNVDIGTLKQERGRCSDWLYVKDD